jgi:hypothetical protein
MLWPVSEPDFIIHFNSAKSGGRWLYSHGHNFTVLWCPRVQLTAAVMDVQRHCMEVKIIYLRANRWRTDCPYWNYTVNELCEANSYKNRERRNTINATAKSGDTLDRKKTQQLWRLLSCGMWRRVVWQITILWHVTPCSLADYCLVVCDAV